MSLVMDLKPEVDIFNVSYFKLRIYVFLSLFFLSLIPFLYVWGHDFNRTFVEGRKTERAHIVNVINNEKLEVKFEDGRVEEKEVSNYIQHNPNLSKDVVYIYPNATGSGGLIFLSIFHIGIIIGLTFLISMLLVPFYDKFLMKPKHIVKGNIQ